MTTVGEARQALIDALGTVPDVRVYADPGATIDPPGMVVALPDLRWEAGCPEPTDAVFEVVLIAKLDDRAIEALQELVLAVTAAVDAIPNAAVIQARTGSWNDQLPAYLIETEMAL